MMRKGNMKIALKSNFIRDSLVKITEYKVRIPVIRVTISLDRHFFRHAINGDAQVNGAFACDIARQHYV